MSDQPVLSELLRINEIGAGVRRVLTPDEAARARIARALDLISLDRFEVDMTVAPTMLGWQLSGEVRADAVQACGLTLEPLPVTIKETFAIQLIATEPEASDEDIDVSVDDDAPDVIENSRIDLGQYALEQLALALDPFPRKAGAEFVQPPEPEEISPFAVLKQFKRPDDETAG